MKLNKANKLSKVVAKEATRYAIRGAKLDKADDGKPVLVATDGRRLAVVPVEDAEDDHEAVLPLDALKAAEKGSKRFPATVSVNGTVRVQADRVNPAVAEFQPEDPESRFPDWRQVVPEKGKGTVRLTVNAKMLHELASALGSDSVTLELVPGDDGEVSDPIRAEPAGEREGQPGSFGVIMPIARV